MTTFSVMTNTEEKFEIIANRGNARLLRLEIRQSDKGNLDLYVCDHTGKEDDKAKWYGTGEATAQVVQWLAARCRAAGYTI